ncbi:MAG: DEAD/DEAH box helicase [Gammaproteobacteria bacterium]|nr:DEAD/DEAH box helicase [Gammaproteobacteria bacterium]
MNNGEDLAAWTAKVRERYENYLRTSFFFREPALRASFQEALQKEEELLKGPFEETGRAFARGSTARALARECFGGECGGLEAALLDGSLYVHQERAVRSMFNEGRNVVVATGTASGKTESFLYPILFELYRQHLAGSLGEPGVRALVLYPMNALANDQRQRLGAICRQLRGAGSDFVPTFGQYIGETRYHGPPGGAAGDEGAPGELLYREQMRETPPHILLTNYSMLEYLLMRPEDSPLFDDGRARHWQFLVLDEGHQYRGAKGMEMGMLLRRLKQRLRQGGREGEFRCIATSATMTSGEGAAEREAVAAFAKALFGEPFTSQGVIFGEVDAKAATAGARRSHAFLRALEGAFLVHRHGADSVVLNRSGGETPGEPPVPLEIALCRECGQHYYVGRELAGRLVEAIRDPSQESFGVGYFLPTTEEAATHALCRRCGELSGTELGCDCDATVQVKRCDSDPDRPDQLRECVACGYQRGSLGDPVQEIVHGSDGPNAVIATALHEVLPAERRKVLAFADSRQEAAFFAWYAQDSYEKLRDRNLILRAMRSGSIDPEGLSVADLGSRLAHEWGAAGLFKESDTRESRERAVLASVFAEALTEERRLSLAGVGLVKWSVKIPSDLEVPSLLRGEPWNLSEVEASELLGYVLGKV